MPLSNLQYECLAKMGIDVFEKRINTIDYTIAVDISVSKITSDEMELLNKILLALRWPRDKVEHCYCPHVLERLKQLAPYKAIIFSDTVEQSDVIKEGLVGAVIALPSLSVLQNNIQAKREAWKAMQPLIALE